MKAITPTTYQSRKPVSLTGSVLEPIGLLRSRMSLRSAPFVSLPWQCYFSTYGSVLFPFSVPLTAPKAVAVAVAITVAAHSEVVVIFHFRYH